MQNIQIMTSRNGMALYVVKHTVKLNHGNWYVVWSDSHTSVIICTEQTFLHCTNITSSKANEDKAFAKSCEQKHSMDREIDFPEMQQWLWGCPEVMTTLIFACISAKLFKQRSTTKMKLDDKENLGWPDRVRRCGEDYVLNVQSSISPSQKACVREGFPLGWHMTPNQMLMHRPTSGWVSTCDEASQFRPHPVELPHQFCKLDNHIQWFHISKSKMDDACISKALHEDMTKCTCDNGLVRRVLLWLKALKEVKHTWGPLKGKMCQNSHGTSRDLCHSLSKSRLEMAQTGPKENAALIDIELERAMTFLFLGLGLTACHQNYCSLKIVAETCPGLCFEHDTPQPGSISLACHVDIGQILYREWSADAPNHEERLGGSQLYWECIWWPSCHRGTNVKAHSPGGAKCLSCATGDPLLDGQLHYHVKTIFDRILLRNKIPISKLSPCLLTQTLDSDEEELKLFQQEKAQDQLNLSW